MLQYTQFSLDRHSANRKDPNWLLDKRPQGRYLLVNNNRNLFEANCATPLYLSYQQCRDFNVDEAIYLGQGDEGHYFAIDVSDVLAEQSQFAGGEFIDIRQYGPTVLGPEAAMLVLARGLIYWHQTHQFCGRCGSKNNASEAGHSRLCSNKACRHMTFPRTDPAVIMLVHKRFSDGIERCLLGRQARWPEGLFSTLAGFVDPGETLEQAVAREVMEEAGVEIHPARYIASQPWPFPSSLMLGFMAEAKSTDIFVDQDELSDARWFSRAQLKEFDNYSDNPDGFKLPRMDSISRYLIDTWLALPEEQK